MQSHRANAKLPPQPQPQPQGSALPTRLHDVLTHVSAVQALRALIRVQAPVHQGEENMCGPVGVFSVTTQGNGCGLPSRAAVSGPVTSPAGWGATATEARHAFRCGQRNVRCSSDYSSDYSGGCSGAFVV
jgi:hypothetical protein